MEEENPALAFLLYRPKTAEGFVQPQVLSVHWMTTLPGYLKSLPLKPAKATGKIWGHYVLWQTEADAEHDLKTQLTSERHAIFHDKLEEVLFKGVFNGEGLDDERAAQFALSKALEVTVYEFENPEAIKAGHAFYEETLAAMDGIKSTLFLPEYGENPQRAIGIIDWETRENQAAIQEKVQHVFSRETLQKLTTQPFSPVLLQPNDV